MALPLPDLGGCSQVAVIRRNVTYDDHDNERSIAIIITMARVLAFIFNIFTITSTFIIIKAPMIARWIGFALCHVHAAAWDS